MKRFHHLPILIVVSILAVAFAGCSNDTTGPSETSLTGTDNYDAIDLNAPNGGLTATDEPVAFNDPLMLQEDALEDQEIYDDPIAASPEVAGMLQNMEQDQEQRRFRSSLLRVVWGTLDGEIDPTTGEVSDRAITDWSGKIQIDHGAVIVRRVIRFERGVDSITRPREDRQTLEWTSFTGGHLDGLLLQIIEPMRAEGDSMMAGPVAANMVHFKAGEFTAEFPTEAIPGMERSAEAGGPGESIQFTGFSFKDLIECPRGFLAGVWYDPDPEVDGGVFRGRWIGLLGHTRGFMAGRYGVNDAGERVFVGKYISRSGQFKGFLGGEWAPGDLEGQGMFRGNWNNEAGTREGVLGGRYRKAGDRPGGFYQGRWASICDTEAVEELQQ